jgi:tetratricopeptide (TPR) repeat protein
MSDIDPPNAYYFPHQADEPMSAVHSKNAAPAWSLGCLLALALPIVFLTLLLFTSGPELTSLGAGWLARSAGRPDLGGQLLESAVVIWPQEARLYDTLGQVYLQVGAVGLAGDAFERAAALDSELAVARNNLGASYLAAQQPEKALTELQAAAELDPGSTLIYLNLGRAQLASGKHTEALSSFQHATGLEPEQPAAWVLTGQAALAGGDLPLALESFETALQVDQANHQALLGLGIIRLMQDRPADALNFLEAARRLAPTDAAAHYFSGIALAALQQPLPARTAFEQALALSNDPALVAQATARLEALLQAPAGEAGQGGAQESTP